MKKILKLIIVCFTVFTIVGCSSEKEVQKKEMNDEVFISNLNEGLVRRWSDDTEITEESSTSEIREGYEKLLNYEFEALGKYGDYTFKDKKLAKLAKEYFESLNLQKQGLEYTTYGNVFPEHNPEERFVDTWQLGYAKRVVALSKINDLYPLTFNEDIESIFDSMLKEYEYHYQFLQGREFMKEINAHNIDLVKDSNKSDSWYTYLTCTLKNPTDSQFDIIQVDVDFYDEDGVIVSQQTDSVYNIAPGQKFKVNFGIDNELNYSSYKTRLSIYYNN